MVSDMPYPDGRPQLVTKPAGCTPEVTARFAAIMASGCYMETACAMLGITRSVAYFWFSEGESAVQELGLETITLPSDNPDEPPRLDPAALAQFTERDQPYVRFWFEVSRAMAKAELHALSLIRDAAIPKTEEQRGGKTGGEWTAAAWFLERRRPEQWGRRTQVTGAGGGPVQVSWVEALAAACAEEEGAADGDGDTDVP